MNRSMNQRSEEARKQATVALEEARERQRLAVAERARMFESEADKVRALRARRIARTESQAS